MPVTGADRNLDFRWIKNPDDTGYTPYEVHYIGANYSFNNFGATPIATNPLIDNQLNHITIILEGQRVQFFVNQVKIIDHTVPGYEYTSEKVGLRLSTGASFPTEGWFDNVKVTTLDHEDEDQGLDVPLLKQTNPLWGNDIYDTAGNWSSNGVTMADWGCAVTSASMVFQYNGLTKMQDDSELNPGSINSWLKNQPDGYVRNGLLNWIALSRLSREVSANNSVAFDALEYARHSVDDAYLTNIIENSQPAILHEPGHFIVAKGVSEEDSTFWINDPYFEINKLSDSKYSNSYAKIGTYTPVNSDLSYMMLVVDSHVEITLLDPVGDQVGEIELEEPISDPENDSNNNVGSLKILYLPKPESGEYELNLSSTTGGSYVLDQYYYDENGEMHVITSTGLLDEGDTNIYLVNYDKDEISNTTSEMLTDEEVTFESIRQKIKDGYKDKKIKFGTYIVLLVELEIAERAKKVKISQGSLNLMVHTLKRDKRIDDDFKSELIEDIQALKDNL